MRWGRISLYGVALNFLGEGVISLIAPAKLTPLVEIAMPTRAAVFEVRGVYGRFFFWTRAFFLLVAGRGSRDPARLNFPAGHIGRFFTVSTPPIMVGDA